MKLREAKRVLAATTASKKLMQRLFFPWRAVAAVEAKRGQALVSKRRNRRTLVKKVRF